MTPAAIAGVNPKRLMDAHEIVVHEVNRDGMGVILGFFREGIRQPREAPHSHPHVEILPLGIRRRDVLRIGIPLNPKHQKA